jgi:8-oxo-dGTP pyrophosphatase MutT (NUDIX family)
MTDSRLQAEPTHAGAVTVRQNEKQTIYLVVSSSNGDHWVLPKGHIETGETPAAAALRELEEEAGGIGEVLAELSLQQFEKFDEAVTVQYFLVRQVSTLQGSEKRTLRWETENEALQLLSFEDARSALREGAAVLRRLSNPI